MLARGFVVSAVVVLVGGFFMVHSSASADGCATRHTLARERAGIVTGSGERIRVIGDSYSVGTGLEELRDSWPSYLPGRVRVDGFSGSGFTRQASPCRGVAYADRAARALASDPALVIVEGGLNDFEATTAAIEAGARRVITRLRGVRLVIVGPAMAPARADQVARVDAALARVAGSARVEYVSTKDWSLSYLPDRLHLTASGQREFGQRVAAAIG